MVRVRVGRAPSCDAQDGAAMFTSTPPLSIEWQRISAFVNVPDASVKRGWLASALRAPPTRKRQVLFSVEGRVDASSMVGLLGCAHAGPVSACLIELCFLPLLRC